MSGITTHVLDTAQGRPAAGVAVTLSVRVGEGWTELVRTATGADGRVPNMLSAQAPASPGTTYRLRFETGAYFAAQGITSFFPAIEVVFTQQDDRHHHVPLLVSPFGYSTYRGT
jgi:5-hydroxyisourate hydrolase